MKKVLPLAILLTCLSACAIPPAGTEAGAVNPTETATLTAIVPSPSPAATETVAEYATVLAEVTVALNADLTPDSRIPPERWQEWPVVPSVSAEMVNLYQRGINLGNHPGNFMKIGDGEISTIWFLTQYDLGPNYYHLGNYTDLLPVIQRFSGSFEHIGLAAGRGFDTTIILGKVPPGTPGCFSGELRLDCELRTTKPAFALISFGTNQIWHQDIFEAELRQIVERLLNAEVVPILSTKADNLEGDGSIDRIIADLAYEYNLPMWNFWLAVQGLPNHGLQSDHEHLTYAYSDFSNPINFQYAWPWRNLTALQVLDSVARGVTGQP